MTITTIIIPPEIQQYFNKNILSYPIAKFSSKNLLVIANLILKKLHRNEFRKFPNTVKKLKDLHQNFMELYERIKTKEEQIDPKAQVKANSMFYRPRFADRNKQRLLEGLI